MLRFLILFADRSRHS